MFPILVVMVMVTCWVLPDSGDAFAVPGRLKTVERRPVNIRKTTATEQAVTVAVEISEAISSEAPTTLSTDAGLPGSHDISNLNETEIAEDTIKYEYKPGDACKENTCSPSQLCAEVIVQCFVAPCYPVGMCYEKSKPNPWTQRTVPPPTEAETS